MSDDDRVKYGSVFFFFLVFGRKLSIRYDLNADDVNRFLPMIDTSKTLIRNVCPSCLSRVVCKPGKYRRADGLCNNVDNPSWGAAMSTFNRCVVRPLPPVRRYLSAP